MTPYMLGYIHAVTKLGAYNTTPSGAAGHFSAQTAIPEQNTGLPAEQIATSLAQLGDYVAPQQEKAKGEETVAEQLERTTGPVSFSTATRVPIDPGTGKLPTNPGIY